LPEIGSMKKGILFVFYLLSSKLILAQNEIGPEGNKLIWTLLFVAVLIVAFVINVRLSPKSATKSSKKLFSVKRIRVKLEKDARYYPDHLILKVKNTGNTDLDLDQPLLVFDNFWLKRKFKLKGMASRTFYPLYLESGKAHSLDIDLTRFYGHDKRLKKFPKAKVLIRDVKGRKLGSSSVFLRKTLFKF